MFAQLHPVWMETEFLQRCVFTWEFFSLVKAILAAYHNQSAKFVLHSSLSEWWGSITKTALECLDVSNENVKCCIMYETKSMWEIDQCIEFFYWKRTIIFSTHARTSRGSIKLANLPTVTEKFATLTRVVWTLTCQATSKIQNLVFITERPKQVFYSLLLGIL